jgi:glycosyltransferase involved in cell wall biosynthesis
LISTWDPWLLTHYPTSGTIHDGVVSVQREKREHSFRDAFDAVIVNITGSPYRQKRMTDMTLTSGKIGMIGIFPPPSGGQGFYNDYVYEELRRRGWPVAPIDVSGIESPSGRYLHTPTRMMLLKELLQGAYTCFLLTASDSRCLGFEFLSALAAHIRHTPFFYNILAGRFADRYASYCKGHRLLLRYALRRAQCIFVSNEDQARHISHITGHPKDDIRVIGCRIPIGDAVIENPELIQFIRSGNPGIVSVGAMREAYGFPLLIRACGRLAEDGFNPCVLLVISGVEDSSTRTQVNAAINATRDTVSVSIRRELPHDEVLGAVHSADLLVRPTYFDGDSLTIHEAIQLGTRVVASDAAPRPQGVHIHRSGDIESLKNGMIHALKSRAPYCSDGDNSDPVSRIEYTIRENCGDLSL